MSFFKSFSEKETKAIAYNFCKNLRPGSVIALEGDLGVGKTVFTKGIAESLNVKEPIDSPTFAIVKEYEGKIPLYHIDAYRLEGSCDILFLEEYFYGNGITVIEWASIIREILPPSTININIVSKGQYRIITINKGENK